MSETIDTDDLEADAIGSWKPWHGQVLGYARALRGAEAQLRPADWSSVPGAQDVRVAFGTFMGRAAKFYADGSDVLEGIARALLKTAQIALAAEDASRADISRVAQELKDL